MTGAEVLETNKWAGQFIPIVPVYGVEVNVEGRRHFRGLVRPAKDAQRMFNYWRTASTELVALAPKAPWIGRRGQFTTDAAKWATANVENHAFMEYDDPNGAGPPQRQPFAGVPAGALQEAMNASNDMKAIIGLYNASLGDQGNEISGARDHRAATRGRCLDISFHRQSVTRDRALRAHSDRPDLRWFTRVRASCASLDRKDSASNVPLNTPVQIGQGPNGEVLGRMSMISHAANMT